MANNSLRIDKSLSFQPQATAPADPRPGQLYVDSTDSNKLKQYITGTGWVAIGDVQGLAGSDWTEYALTIGGATTAPTKGAITLDKAMWRRVGGGLDFSYNFEQSGAGTAGSGTYLFPLPAGLSIDTAKLPPNTNGFAVVGNALVYNGGAIVSQMAVSVYDANNLMMRFDPTYIVSSSFCDLSAAGVIYSMSASGIPIVGWSSNVTMASDPAALPGVLVIADNTGISTTANTPIQYPQTIKDVYGGYSSATGLYTCSVAGDYLITVVAVATSGNQWYVAKNGVGQQIIMDTLLNEVHSGATMVSLAVGDTVAIQGAASVTLNTPTPPQYYNYVTLSRVTGSTSIALDGVREQLVMGVSGTPPGFGSAGTATLRFDVTVSQIGSGLTYVDSAVDGGRIVVGSSGVYSVTAGSYNSAGTPNSMGLALNSTDLTAAGAAIPLAERISSCDTLAGGTETTTGTIIMIAGDYITFQISPSMGVGTTPYTFMRVTKVGN